jgi:hypothetical protein
MGFIFGLIIGAAVTSGGSVPAPMLGSIPFRCLAAFDISEAEYRQCRTISLQREIYEGTPCRRHNMSDPADPCSFDKAITWEIAGLREMKAAMQQKQSAKN